MGRSSLSDSEFVDDFEVGEKEKIEKAIEGSLDWLAAFPLAGTDEFEAEQKELDQFFRTIQIKHCIRMACKSSHSFKSADMRIFVKISNGKTIPLDVEANARIHAVKAKIKGSEGIPSTRRRLIFAAPHLRWATAPGRPFPIDYSIWIGSTISLHFW